MPSVNTSLAGATQEEVRRHNLSRLVRILHVHGAMSRADLTRLTRLNRSTIGALTTDLANAGLVREGAPVGRGVGRPSIVVAPNSEGVFALAFDLRVERTIGAVVGLGGRVLARREVDHTRRDTAPSEVLGGVERLADELFGEVGKDATCIGIGLAVPGVIRHTDGLVRFAPNMGWVDVPIASLLRGILETSLPILVSNDADLGAISEHVRGAAAGSENVVFLSGEVGVGGGIILGGRLMMGSGGYGGEVGHMVVNPTGRSCRCGRRGCWETEIGEDAVLKALGGSQGDDVDALLGPLSARAPGDVGELDRVARWLGLGLANLVNIFNPEVVVFGGLLRKLLPIVEDNLLEQFDTALVAPREQVRLALPALGRDSTLLGAAESVFAPMLDDPLKRLGPTRATAMA
jgi:predicted NBD/HSP70 family sugar kinase